MKIRQLFAALLIAVPATSLAGLNLPSKVFEESELDKAKTEAAAKGKPLAILYTDKDSTCPLCNAAAGAMIKELGNKTIMVYVRSTNEMPANVQKALTPGKYIPKIAVFDDKLEKSLGMVTYESVKDDSRKAFREVERAIKDYRKAE